MKNMNKKLSNEEKFMIKELKRAIKVIKGKEKPKIIRNDVISLDKFCDENKDILINKKKIYSYLREKEFLHYDVFRNNVPTKKSIDYEYMYTKKSIMTDVEKGTSSTYKSPILTKKGQDYFLEILKKENFKDK